MKDGHRVVTVRIVNGSVNFVFFDAVPRQRRVALRIVASGEDFIAAQLEPGHQARPLNRIISGAVDILARQFILWSRRVLRIAVASVVEFHYHLF